ncbi:MAG: TRAM domain-containing protein [ANME-2 cluster archaeon]|nr:MAG: TRAM domain-containing protein [ANME-2 cluster archaeon]
MFKQETYDAPVTEGESYDVTIEDLAREGDGVARIEGFVIFVPGTKVGDSVKIKVEKVMRRFAIAAVED